MTKIIEAVYENGVFKPLEKVNLKEGEKVRLRIDDKKVKRLGFLSKWKPIELDVKITAQDVKKLRLEKYEDIS